MKEYSNTKRRQGTISNRFILMVLLLFILISSLQAEARHALVIGNGNYEDLGMLKNPANDATDMAGALSNLGFEVQTLIDADVVSMEEAIVRFGQRLSGSVDSVGFFFYAGHGVQHNGSNYLIPAGAKIASEVFLRTRSISAQAVLDTMQAAGNRLNIVVLDACRDNPFSWARSGQRGLSVVASQPPGSIIAYATSAGSVAGDGDGRNGIFTAELLRILAIPGIDVSELFRLTGQAVQERTAGRQIPAIYSQFFGKKTLFGSQTTGLGENGPPAVVQPKAPLQSAAARQNAELFIESSPLGADITIDGRAKGKTPIFLDDVMAGTLLAVEARLGTMSARETYRVNEGFNQLTMVLEQEKGNLFIQNCEVDAELYIDGVRIGTVGSGLIRDVDAGRRTVEIRVPGRKAVHMVEIIKDSTTKLVPEFISNLYTVNFDATGGYLTGNVRTLEEAFEKYRKQIHYQEKYGELPVPLREGYSFSGWWTSPNRGGMQVLATTTYSQTQDQRLYASWSANSYTVSFDSQGGSEPSPRSKSVVYGQSYGSLPTVSRAGYSFHGWWTETSGGGMEVLPSTIANITGYQTLYAKWERSSIPLTYVEGGTFQMGNSSGGDDEERPVHRVTVDSFYMGTYEVTQDIYEEMMGSNPSHWEGKHLPVEQVSWIDAVKFANVLSRYDGLDEVYTIRGSSVSCDWSKRGYRLPTEAEWEYAARGGKHSRGYTYAGSNMVGEVAWYISNSGYKTHDVGIKKANELGLHDMSGNVWEWCWDLYGIYPALEQTNPRGPELDSTRVVRGGSWSYSAAGVQLAFRNSNAPSDRSNYGGFRLVLPAELKK